MDEMGNPTPVQEKSDMKQYYVLGVVVLIAIAIAGYMLRPKSATMMDPTTPGETQQQVMNTTPTPTPGPITGLQCDTEYYNSKIGFAEYYLTVEGGDVSTATNVNCAFTVKAANNVLATANVTSPLTASPQRGGSTFRCTTQAIAITPRVATTVDIVLSDNLGKTATCSAPFVFPAP